jgi:hypothetical protein
MHVSARPDHASGGDVGPFAPPPTASHPRRGQQLRDCCLNHGSRRGPLIIERGQRDDLWTDRSIRWAAYRPAPRSGVVPRDSCVFNAADPIRSVSRLGVVAGRDGSQLPKAAVGKLMYVAHRERCSSAVPSVKLRSYLKSNPQCLERYGQDIAETGFCLHDGTRIRGYLERRKITETFRIKPPSGARTQGSSGARIRGDRANFKCASAYALES